MQQIVCELLKLLTADLKEFTITAFGAMMDLLAISVCRGTQCIAKLPTPFKKSRFL